MTAEAKQVSGLTAAYPESFFHKKAKKSVSQTDMQAILAKRNAKVTHEPVSAAERMGVSPLVWLPKRDGESFIESQCGRFTIVGSRDKGTLRYLAFVRSIPAGWPTTRGTAESRKLIGGFESPRAAKAACL